MGLLDILSGGSSVIGGVMSLSGLLDANKQRQQQAAAQQAALNSYAQSVDQHYNNLQQQNQLSQYGAAGSGGDAIKALGSNLGSEMAGAGVYNSSATAGALVNAQRDTNASLTDLSARNTANAQNYYDQGQQNLANLKLGVAGQGLGYARQDAQNSASGFAGYLGALTQNTLGKTGANAARTAVPGVNGTINQGANLPGNAGGVGNGGQGMPDYGGGNPLYPILGLGRDPRGTYGR